MLPKEARIKIKTVVDLPPPGGYGFIGREEEIGRLERAFDKASIVLLSGPAGVGKTDLACQFGRRLGDTGSRTGSVLFTAFDHNTGLCRLLHEVGTTLEGIGFAGLSLEQQRQRILDYVKTVPCLLIWDSFDSAFQDGLDQPQLGSHDAEERQELLDLLRDISDGPSWVLITCRDEGRIKVSTDCGHEKLRGLNDADSQQLARLMVDGADGDTQGTGPDYLELLRRLKGNPMAMKVVLPHLKQHPPAGLLQAVQQSEEEKVGEFEILDAALDCSFSLLSPRTRAHLPFLALFRQRVLLDVLTFMTQGEAYVSVMEEEVGWGACRAFLREAVSCGMLDSLSPSAYLISPQASEFLHRQLGQRLAPSQASVLEQEFLRVYADTGDYFMENLSSETFESTVTGVLAEEANLLQALHLAQARGQWESAQLVLQPLAQVYKMQERILELRRLRKRLLAYVGPEAGQAEAKGAIELWLYLQGTEVSDAVGRGELQEAEGICNTVLEYLKPMGDSTPQGYIASIYHHMGLIAQARSQYEGAEGWYSEALKISESLGNEAECADSYHQLGLIAQIHSRYEDADEWHRRALDIRERLGDEAELASDCYQLALVAEARYGSQEAVEWYHRARAAYEQVDDRSNAAAIYHRLGLIAQAQYDYEEATEWYQKTLLAYESLEDEVSGANDYYQLGAIALERYEYEEAEEWLRQAVEVYELTGNEAAAAEVYHRLGIAAHSQRRHQEAEEWYHKALTIFLRLGDEVAAASTWGQLGLLADARGHNSHAVWYVAHTYEIATAHQLSLLDHAKAHLSALRSKMGTEAFLSAWQEVSDTDVLSEL